MGAGMRKVNFFSIRFRIMLLSAMGIVGMAIIAGTGWYLDRIATVDQEVAESSQQIVRLLSQATLKEEQFIRRPREKLVQQHNALTKQIESLVSDIMALAGDPKVQSKSRSIVSLTKTKAATFARLAEAVYSIGSINKEIFNRIQSLTAETKKSVAQIDQEQAEKTMLGETPDPIKAELRGLLLEFAGFWDKRLLTIQNLLLFGDTDWYVKQKDKLEQALGLMVRNTSAAVGATMDKNLEKRWTSSLSSISVIDKLENNLVSNWKKNGTLMTSLADISARAEKAAMEIVAHTREASNARRNAGNVIRAVVTFGGIAVMLGLSLLILRAVIGPIGKTVAMIRDIAEGEGDLTKRLEASSRDEIGELARWFNTFIDNLQKMIANIASNIVKMRKASGELSEIAQIMAQGSEQTSAKAQTVAAASEKMSANMNSVATAMGEATNNVNIMATATEEMTATINEIAHNAENARSTTQEAVDQASYASSQVSELGEAADEIGKVVETITEISEQVNLLALNATIEAARAGEAGKGFAVVANEIKELARQTADATLEIKQRVEGIQNTTEGTISHISAITSVVNDVNEIVGTIATAVEEQSVTTKEISSNIVQASDSIANVNENVAQSSEVSNEITREIAEVNLAAGDMSNSSAQVNLSAEALNDLSQQLNDMVKRFKI